jgi:hypothetical protein
MDIKIVKATLLNADQKNQICNLWNTEYPQKLAISPVAFDAYLGESSGHSHFLILENNTDLIGWANTFERAGERW